MAMAMAACAVVVVVVVVVGNLRQRKRAGSIQRDRQVRTGRAQPVSDRLNGWDQRVWGGGEKRGPSGPMGPTTRQAAGSFIGALLVAHSIQHQLPARGGPHRMGPENEFLGRSVTA
ncbi:hypothetical protein B0T22DRAFT_438904 [Podospora appendiculata]|uniref:Secreted protein n=1 Tax=Podospora appendiculata TaxID=314037 RepID=A0AAE0X6Y1_9PEZI|nr:hypothetical protein B0T22DRAFT_438904 [Podospora appendiculata]